LQGSYKDSLVLLEENLPGAFANTDLAARRKMVQGLANEYSEHFDEAAADLAEAERIADSSHPQLQGEIARARGTLESDRKNYDAADAALHQGLLIAREHNLRSLEATMLGDLGLVAMKREHYDEAIDWDRSALHLSRDLKANVYAASILGNMGWSYFSMGDFDNAKSLFEQAESASAHAGLSGDHVYWLINIGDVQFAQREYQDAEATMKQALQLARNLNDNGAVIQCLNNLSQIALDSGAIDAAEKYNSEASALQRAGLDKLGVLTSTLVSGRIESGKHHFAGSERKFQSVIQNPGAESALRWEAESRLAKVYQNMGQPAKAEREFTKSIETIDAVRTSVKSEEFRMPFLSSAVSFYNDFIGFLISQGRPEDALAVAEISRARTLSDGLGIRSAGLSFPIKDFRPKQIAGQLKTSVLSYWLGSPHSYLWIVTPQKVVLFTLPPANEIDPLVESYRKALIGPRDVLESDNAAGKKLYDLLVGPAQALIPKGSHVTILPDGSLYNLNFETLLAPDKTGAHYWIEDVTVTNANSIRLLSRFDPRTSTNSTKKLLLIGNPVSPSTQYEALPNAAVEVSSIQKHFLPDSRTVLTQAEAIPAAYTATKPDQFSYIHFVAHGTASRLSPLDSAIVLSTAGGEDDFKLYARDILHHSLKADLVTISACYSAGERSYAGEGLVGLSWAFLKAGAHNVVAALWEATDAPTEQLMNHFYDELDKGSSPDVALRTAKLSLLHGGNFRNPFYWAPFQLYGGQSAVARFPAHPRPGGHKGTVGRD